MVIKKKRAVPPEIHGKQRSNSHLLRCVDGNVVVQENGNAVQLHMSDHNGENAGGYFTLRRKELRALLALQEEYFTITRMVLRGEDYQEVLHKIDLAQEHAREIAADAIKRRLKLTIELTVTVPINQFRRACEIIRPK